MTNLFSAPFLKLLFLSAFVEQSEVCFVQVSVPYNTMKTSASVEAPDLLEVKVVTSYGVPVIITHR